MIKEYAYAKINLTLEVKEKREDNFHEAKTIMTPINLYDVLTFKKISEGIKIIEEKPIKNNFVYIAAKLFFDTYNIRDGVEITLLKHIPICAGLAGGSSDAAATLRGLNRLFNLNKSLEELALLSEALGTDMPYCVYQKTAICTGRGEKVEVLNIKVPKIPILLIKPYFGLSTKDVFKDYKYNAVNRDNNFTNVINGLINNDVNMLNENIFNDLFISSKNISLKYGEFCDKINDKGYLFHQSGSGPTIYILGATKKDLELIRKDFKKTFTKLITLLGE